MVTPVPILFSLTDYCQANAQGATVEIGLCNLPANTPPMPGALFESTFPGYRRASDPAEWIAYKGFHHGVAYLRSNVLRWRYTGSGLASVNAWFALATVGAAPLVLAWDLLDDPVSLSPTNRFLSLNIELQGYRTNFT